MASTLLGNGTARRFVIGSVNAAEFTVATAVSVTLPAAIGMSLWPITGGLVVGGALAAYVVDRIANKALMILVGAAVMLLTLRNLAGALG